MSFDLNRLYDLLPAIYRSRDVEAGEPLKALLAVIADQVAVVEENLEQLYDDLFIETCAEWVVPYIGDVVGARQFHPVAEKVSLPRAVVANTIRYRRSKGTLAILEQLARDVTGWDARAVEYFRHLATTQYLNHVRPENLAFTSLRPHVQFEDRGSAFDRLAYTAEVRRIEPIRGRYNIPNIGLFLWRVRSRFVDGGTARQVAEGSYTFHPLGVDTPLFNDPVPEPDIVHLAQSSNVPHPLSRRLLYAETEALRQGFADGRLGEVRAALTYFGTSPVVSVGTVTDGTPSEIEPNQILICDLSDEVGRSGPPWRRPPATKEYYPPGETEPIKLPIAVAIDPVLGRLSFPDDSEFNRVEVSYRHGSAVDIGGGFYPRGAMPTAGYTLSADVAEATDQIGDLVALVDPPGDLSLPNIIEVPSSYTLQADSNLRLREGEHIILRAAKDARPVILGNVHIVSAEEATVVLDGLLIAGVVTVAGTARTTVVVRHCTIGLPPDSSEPACIDWSTEDGRGTLRLEQSITGEAIRLQRDVSFECVDSFVHGIDLAIGRAGVVRIVASTVIGLVLCREVDLIENSIMMGQVQSDRVQRGCVRFSYLPWESTVPRRYRCRPASAEEAIWMRPIFTSLRYGDPAYGQLSLRCPREIREGADDDGEMGVLHHLHQAQREANLRAALQEYLRFGLEAGIFYSS